MLIVYILTGINLGFKLSLSTMVDWMGEWC